MKYYAQYDNNGKLIAIGTDFQGIEITENEYYTLLSDIRSKAQFVNKLYNEEIDITEIPTEWQEEIINRVNNRIALEGTVDEQEIDSSEFLDMVKEALQ